MDTSIGRIEAQIEFLKGVRFFATSLGLDHREIIDTYKDEPGHLRDLFNLRATSWSASAFGLIGGAVAATSAGLAIPVSLVGTVPALLASGIYLVRSAVSTEKDIGEAVRLEVETHRTRTTAAPASQP